ncbi:MAG: DUF2330 domain-containing protein [Actinobacteria bacterium]|nr:DUF2330 domain-containing protein [Actinomycetota bacterium]
MARRLSFVLSLSVALVLASSSAAFACGGLIGPRGSVNLIRTATLAAYHQGVEHYVTSFTFTGTGGGKFGSIVPLPGVPTKVERGGSWTLQRLEREVAPPVPAEAGVAFASAGGVHKAEVLQEVAIDALDITILKGGGAEVGAWAEENGFDLPPDAPEVLDFYANRSPIFMAARFNASRAKASGAQSGDGTPIHLTIPTPSPWVPLRILRLGKNPAEFIQADVFLLTDRAPAVLPAPQGLGGKHIPEIAGMELQRSEAADGTLLRDLHFDKGMSWVPLDRMWFSYLAINTPAAQLSDDLAIDASGGGQPSWVAAGLAKPVSLAVNPVERPIQQIVKQFPVVRVATRSRSAGPITAAAVAALVAGLLIGSQLRRRAPIAS